MLAESRFVRYLNRGRRFFRNEIPLPRRPRDNVAATTVGLGHDEIFFFHAVIQTRPDIVSDPTFYDALN